MGNAKFRGLLAPKPSVRFSKKFAQLLRSWTPPHMQILASIGSKGASLRMREIVTLRRLIFFSFFRFRFMRLATGRPVGPIIAVNGCQMTRSGGHYVVFMVSLIKKLFFSIFYPKMWKIALRPTGTLNSYNFGTVVDTYKLFHQTGGFRAAQSNGVIQICPRLTLVAMATKRSYFNTKLAITQLQ